MQQEALEDMDTPALDKLLQAELAKEDTDSDLVRRITHVLDNRDRENPVEVSPEVQALFEQFVQQGQRKKKPAHGRWVSRAAVALAILIATAALMVSVFPMEAKAGSWWDRITRWSSEKFEFISHRNLAEERPEYEFRTDNPGLQEVYDAVVALGVTDPVVPMWLPEGYILDELKQIPQETKTNVYARFSSDGTYIIYTVDIYRVEEGDRYNINKENAVEYETNGVTHYIMQNNERCVSAWTKKNAECSLTIDGAKERMCEILDSIYSTWR